MASTSSSTPPAPPGALLAGLLCRDNVHLVLGTGSLAATRCAQSLAAGARPVLVAAPRDGELHPALRAKIASGAVRWEDKAFEDGDLFRLGRPDVGGVVDAVFVARARGAAGDDEAARVAALCKRNRVPINVVDAPALCSFTLLSVHTDGPLQVGVTTNGNGCRLASRIRRDVAASLPRGLGLACARLGEVRRHIYGHPFRDDEGHDGGGGGGGGGRSGEGDEEEAGQLDDSLGQGARFNRLVTADQDQDTRSRRMRWLSQVCEYWPLSRLASIADSDVDRLLAACPGFASDGDGDSNGLASTPQPGTLILAGSGPGHPSLLTRATIAALERADVVLADKLVPSAVLDLVPRRATVHIARKFPGNADAAQDELLDAALVAVRAGRTVVRLKQGDPFLYGRGGEELAWFGARGLAHRVAVLPGVSSALAAPLFAGIPVTQRGVADQVLFCTGTGRRGKPPAPPAHVATRTVVFLMALHRISDLIRELTTRNDDDDADAPRALWPPATPCAVVERASCPDQRVIRTTLAHVAHAVDAEGSRPPGLLVVGPACEAVRPRPPNADDGPPAPWTVEEGFRALDDLAPLDVGGADGHRLAAAAAG